MPIEHSAGGTCITGDSINFFQIGVHRGVVKLEMLGFKSRGRVMWRVYREYYKIPKLSKATGKPIKGNANIQDVYDWLDAKVQELRSQQEHVTVENGRTVREVEGQEVM